MGCYEKILGNGTGTTEEEHLFYTHANLLKARVNKAFERLKKLRDHKNKEFEKESIDNTELIKKRILH